MAMTHRSSILEAAEEEPAQHSFTQDLRLYFNPGRSFNSSTIIPAWTGSSWRVFQNIHGSGGCRNDGDVFRFHGDGPGDVELGGQLPHHHIPEVRDLGMILKPVNRRRHRAPFYLPQDFGTVVVVLHGVFHKAETVDVTNVGVAVSSQEVEAAHGLLGIAQRR